MGVVRGTGTGDWTHGRRPRYGAVHYHAGPRLGPWIVAGDRRSVDVPGRVGDSTCASTSSEARGVFTSERGRGGRRNRRWVPWDRGTHRAGGNCQLPGTGHDRSVVRGGVPETGRSGRRPRYWGAACTQAGPQLDPRIAAGGRRVTGARRSARWGLDVGQRRPQRASPPRAEPRLDPRIVREVVGVGF